MESGRRIPPPPGVFLTKQAQSVSILFGQRLTERKGWAIALSRVASALGNSASSWDGTPPSACFDPQKLPITVTRFVVVDADRVLVAPAGDADDERPLQFLSVAEK